MPRTAVLVALALLTACTGEPVAPGLSLMPEAPRTTDDLELSMVVPNDAHQDVEYTISWTRDGVETGHDGMVIPAADTTKGETWEVSVVTSLKKHTLEPVTASVTIQNTPPTVDSASISPADPRTDDDLTCTASGVADVDEGELDTEIRWAIGGTEVGGGSTLASDAFVKGDVVTCTVVANDGDATSDAVSDSVTVLNTPPGTPEVTITPESPAAGAQPLICTVELDAPDADGDVLDYVITWEADGSAYPDDFTGARGPSTTTWTDDTVPAADTTLAETWTCHVAADDGEATGPETSASVVVTDTCIDLTVAALPGWGGTYENSSLIWTGLQSRQADYGPCTITFVDVPHGFTRGSLVDTGAEVLLVANPGGGNVAYSDGERTAIEEFVTGGDGGLVLTYAVAYNEYGWLQLADLAGVDQRVVRNTGVPATTTVTALDAGHPLLSGLPGTFEAGGFDSAQAFSTTIEESLLDGATHVATTGSGDVIAYEGEHRAVWFTWMIEYQTTTTDGERLLYNGLVWAAGYAP